MYAFSIRLIQNSSWLLEYEHSSSPYFPTGSLSSNSILRRQPFRLKETMYLPWGLMMGSPDLFWGWIILHGTTGGISWIIQHRVHRTEKATQSAGKIEDSRQSATELSICNVVENTMYIQHTVWQVWFWTSVRSRHRWPERQQMNSLLWCSRVYTGYIFI